MAGLFLITIWCAASFSANSASNEVWGVELSAVGPRLVFPGRAARVAVKVTNHSKRVVTYRDAANLPPVVVRVLDGSGTQVPLTKEGRRKIGLPGEMFNLSMVRDAPLKPGASFDYTCDLRDFFVLENGKTYTLT